LGPEPTTLPEAPNPPANAVEQFGQNLSQVYFYLFYFSLFVISFYYYYYLYYLY